MILCPCEVLTAVCCLHNTNECTIHGKQRGKNRASRTQTAAGDTFSRARDERHTPCLPKGVQGKEHSEQDTKHTTGDTFARARDQRHTHAAPKASATRRQVESRPRSHVENTEQQNQYTRHIINTSRVRGQEHKSLAASR